jgi:hypothetical protein
MTADASLNQDTRTDYGQQTVSMVNQHFGSGGERGVLLMRHSAREFNRDINDLLNPLTDHGRQLCVAMGEALSDDIQLRGYASPPERCMETAELLLQGAGHTAATAPKVRPLEALGVFYALDQIRMCKGMRTTGGLEDYLSSWFAGKLSPDVMMPPSVAVAMVLKVLRGRLDAPALGDKPQLDVCVSHDMTLYTVRHGSGLEPIAAAAVEFLDGLLMYRDQGQLLLRSHHGGIIEVDEGLLSP